MFKQLARAMYASCAVAAIAATALTGCSASAGDQNSAVTVIGPFGVAPTVAFPRAPAGSTSIAKTLITGHGGTVVSSDSFVGNYVMYAWHGTTHILVHS